MNILNLYEKYFDTETKTVFEILSDYNVYLVGGLVRDLLLNRKSNDIDITVEGDAIELAKKLNCEILSIHKDFGTVKIKINNKNIDLASTRTEFYPKKGHLPVIKKIACSLKEDISRRDFTINSIAMSLNKNSLGEIIDYTGGVGDLNAKKIKILHDESFIDDPSRILRNLKYSNRLGFSPDKKTKLLQDVYLSNINYDMSLKRILQEFFKIEWSENVFKFFIEDGIYKLINPDIFKELKISNNTKTNNFFEHFDFWIQPTNPIIFLGLLLPNEKFDLPKKERQIINFAKDFLSFQGTNLDTYKTFSNLPVEVAEILSILKNKNAKNYLKELKDIQIFTTGKDLINLGLKPSKDFKKIFDLLIDQKLKKTILSKNDELNFIKTNFLKMD